MCAIFNIRKRSKPHYKNVYFDYQNNLIIIFTFPALKGNALYEIILSQKSPLKKEKFIFFPILIMLLEKEYAFLVGFYSNLFKLCLCTLLLWVSGKPAREIIINVNDSKNILLLRKFKILKIFYYCLQKRKYILKFLQDITS